MLCWKCKESMQGLVCVGCSAIRPPPAQPDFYEVFELKRSYFVDAQEVSEAHLRLAKILHPDRWRQASAVERRMSKQWMAMVNEGERILKDPIAKARYLATGTATVAETGGSVPSGFLERIFALQMRAMEEPEEVRAEAQALLEASMNSLTRLFQELEDRGVTDFSGSKDAVEERLGEIKYLQNLVQKI